jgi:hypothetical protein
MAVSAVENRAENVEDEGVDRRCLWQDGAGVKPDAEVARSNIEVGSERRILGLLFLFLPFVIIVG